LLHWPASPSEERAGLPALAPATRRPSRHLRRKEKARCRAMASLRGLRSNPRPSIHQDLRSWVDTLFTATRIECHLCFHAQHLVDPLLSRMNLMRIPAQAPLHALRQIHNRCAVFNPPGARRIRADLAPGGFNTAPSQRAGYRRLMNSAPHQSLRADQRDGSYVPSRRTTRISLSVQSPGEDRFRRTAPPQ